MKTLLTIILFGLMPVQQKEKVILKTKSRDIVSIMNDRIYYNSKIISGPIDGIIYNSKYNRIIEDGNSMFLFIEVDDRPDYNMLEVYSLTKQKATKLLDAAYNDSSQGWKNYPISLTDADKDGHLEFGGFGINEGYDNEDSMYYSPSVYYEIKNGKITFDSVLTKKMDIKMNGVYLKKPFDKNGNCCVVVRKPKK
jgi:hypothetical protein